MVGLEACRALDVAHQRGIVHTEITPSKLVFGDDRRLRIVDFGLAELLGADDVGEPGQRADPRRPLRLAGAGAGHGDRREDRRVRAVAVADRSGHRARCRSPATRRCSTLAGRVGKLMPVSADLGSLAAVLERAGRPDSEDRSTAAEFGRGLVQAAEKLPRPEPIPLIATGLFTHGAGCANPRIRPVAHDRPRSCRAVPRSPTPVVPLEPTNRSRPIRSDDRPRPRRPGRAADRADRHRRRADPRQTRPPAPRTADCRRRSSRTAASDADRCHRRRCPSTPPAAAPRSTRDPEHRSSSTTNGRRRPRLKVAVGVVLADRCSSMRWRSPSPDGRSCARSRTPSPIWSASRRRSPSTRSPATTGRSSANSSAATSTPNRG